MAILFQVGLGVSGVEGTFRLSAEATLLALRKAERTLAALLSTTLDDLAIELASGHHTSALRKVHFYSLAFLSHCQMHCFIICWYLSSSEHATLQGKSP